MLVYLVFSTFLIQFILVSFKLILLEQTQWSSFNAVHNTHYEMTLFRMLNKNTYGAKKARPIRSSSYLTIAATKSFDIS